MTLVLDSAAAIQRALARVGKPDGAGACLEHVYQDFGGPAWSSIGRGAGQYGTAIAGWNFADYRFPGDWTPPPGVPVYFGIDTSRTDRNAKAGDVVMSLGGGRCVATDAPDGNSGVMTLAARAKQVRRNYLGWTADFLGYPVSGALSYIAQRDGAHPTVTPPIVVTQQIPEVPPMFNLVPDALSKDVYAVSLTTGKRVKVLGPGDLTLLKRLRANDGTDAMLMAEVQLCEERYLSKIA